MVWGKLPWGCRKEMALVGWAEEWARMGWSWAAVMGRGQSGLAVREERAKVLVVRTEEQGKQSGPAQVKGEKNKRKKEEKKWKRKGGKKRIWNFFPSPKFCERKVKRTLLKLV
jgi:hypothetical protein